MEIRLKRRLILGITGAMLAVVAFSGSVAAATPTSTPTSKYVWDDATSAYAGPAAMLVNKAGAIVWWHVPGDDDLYKDVYRFQDFEGATHWGPVSTLNSPVNNLMLKHFPATRTCGTRGKSRTVVPNLGQPTRIFTLRDSPDDDDRGVATLLRRNETLSGGFIIADPYAPAISVKATGVVGDIATRRVHGVRDQ